MWQNQGNNVIPPEQIQRIKQLMSQMNGVGVNPQAFIQQIGANNPQFATILNMINMNSSNWQQSAQQIARMLYAQRGIDLDSTIQQLQS